MQRVLVVDDDRLVAETLALIFAKNGFESRAVYSAGEALDCVRGFTPDLLLCDVTMPDRDGLSLVSDITAEFPACRVIVLTAFYSNLKSAREHSIKMPHPMGILAKPCQPSELLREATAMLTNV